MTTLAPGELALRLDHATQLAAYAVERTRMGAPAGQVRLKGRADWVTDADLDIEQQVRAVLGEKFPSDAVVGEELPNRPVPPGSAVWYVDPVDGTTNFAHGLRSCSFSLALADGAGLALGVVAEPWSGETFTAVRGQGAWANGRRLSCMPGAVLEGALVLTELKGPAPWTGMTALVERLGETGCATRILGSCALSLANVAAGRAAGLVLGAAHPIDIAAGALLVREAGGVVMVGSGVDRVLGPDDLGEHPALVAAAPGLLPALLAALGRGPWPVA